MFNFVRTAGLAAVAALSMTAAADAAIVYATGVTIDNVGTGAGAPGRNDPLDTLGAADGNFYSLGLGGAATFTFLPAAFFKGPLSVVEITFGNRAKHVEIVDIYGIAGMTSTFLGTITNSTLVSSLNFAGIFSALQLVDGSVGKKGRDGFDIDSVSVAAVPLPAGGLLLLSGLAGIAALRRRKAAV